MTPLSIIFFCLATAVFALFFLNVRKNWLQLATTGLGKEEVRHDQFVTRMQNLAFGGLIQKKMFDDPSAGIMHFLIFWGFVTVSIGTLETLLHGIYPPLTFANILGSQSTAYRTYLVSQDIANFCVCISIGMALVRRLIIKPRRLADLKQSSKNDALIVLSLILALVSTALITIGSDLRRAEGSLDLLEMAPFSAIASAMIGGLLQVDSNSGWSNLYSSAWWLHIAVLFGFTSFLPFSKHQHLIWVWPNLFFNSLKGSGRLRPMTFEEDAESFGVGTVSEFTWKQLLDSITCVECGRCSQVCPATNTQKPLDPRLMIHHLKEAMQNQESKDETTKQKSLIGDIVSRDELWACTTCGACMEACPLAIEHIPAIVDMRRYMTMTEGEVPTELQSTLEKLEAQNNPWGLSQESRADWAKGLDIPTMAEKKEVDYLFWVGCAGSYDDRYKKVSQSISKIMKKANLDFAILGTEEKCNGDTARRAGNEYLADMQIRENIDTLGKYKFRKVVTGCPHCFNTIKNEYPDFGLDTEVVHHTELIAELKRDGKLEPKTQTPNTESKVNKTTFHDSCYLGRHNNITSAPREALSTLKKVDLVEMPRNKKNGFCCGAGGARMWMEETIGERINVARAKEAISTGASTIATSCPFCMTMMKDGVTAEQGEGPENQIAIKDVAELVAEQI